MDVLVPKVGEIIGGSQREEHLETLRARMAEMHVPEEALKWYLDLRKYGSVPHAGFGLGFERLIMYGASGTGLTRGVGSVSRVLREVDAWVAHRHPP